MKLCKAVDAKYGDGGWMINDPNGYNDYSEFLATEMIIDEPKFEQFMMRFADMNVRIWNIDPLAVEYSKLSVVWGAGSTGKLSIIQQLNDKSASDASESSRLVGVILKMALYLGRTSDAKIPQFFFS